MECFNKMSLFTWLSNAFSLFHNVSERSDGQLLPCVVSVQCFSKEMIKSTPTFPPPAPGQASSSNEACHKQWFVQRALKVKKHIWGPFWKSISVTFVCCKDEEAAGCTCPNTQSCHHFSLSGLKSDLYLGFPSPADASRVCRVHPVWGETWGWKTFYPSLLHVLHFYTQIPNEGGIFDSRWFHLELHLD